MPATDKPTPTDIAVDEALLKRLFIAQMTFVRDTLTDILGRDNHYIGDDGHDDFSAMLEILETLRSLEYECAVDGLAAWLNSPINHDGVAPDHVYLDHPLNDYACDGICPEIYALNPRALYWED